MKKGFRALSLIVFVIGLLSFSLARGQRKNETDIEPSRPFVAVSYVADSTPDGKKTITSWRTRYVKANSEFRVVMHGLDEGAAFAYDAAPSLGTSATVLAGTSEGVYLKPYGATERNSLGSSSAEKSWDSSVPEQQDKRFHSHSYLRNHPEFVRMDKMAGLTVYVMRTNADGYWVETCYSPLTGITPLRAVVHQLDGSESMMEVVKIDFRDVPDDLNGDIKALPKGGHLGNQPAPAKKPNSN